MSHKSDSFSTKLKRKALLCFPHNFQDIEDFFVGSDERKTFWHSTLRFLTILHTLQLTPPCFSHVFLAECGDFAGKVWSLTFWLLDILLLLIGKECIFSALFPFHCPLLQWPRPPRCPLLGQLKCSCRTQLSIIRPEGSEQGLGRRGKEWGENMGWHFSISGKPWV